jgi:hypothetical protein
LAAFTRSRGAYVWPLPSSPVNPVDYFVAFGPDSDIDTAPGTVVTHTLTLRNVGLMDDSYTLAMTEDDWPTDLLTASPVVLPAGMTATISVAVEVPNVPYETDSFIVTATSVTSPTVPASAEGTTNSVVYPDVVATPDSSSLSGLPFEVLTYTITVENTGDYTDTFAVDYSGNAWDTSLSAVSVGPLAPGASSQMEVYVIVGANEADDTVTVTFTSGLDSGVSDSVDLTSVRASYDLFVPLAMKS